MLADYFDDMGVDGSLSIAVIAAAFEMYDRGLITKEDVERFSGAPAPASPALRRLR